MLKATATLTLAALLCGCAASSSSPSNWGDGRYPLSPSELDRGTLVFRQAQIDAAKFSGFYVDTVAIYRGDDADFGPTTEAQKQDIAGFMKSEFERALSAKYRVVTAPGPGILRVRLTLVGVALSQSAAATVMRLTPAGLALTLGRGAMGLPAAMTGSVAFAGELIDCSTETTLAAFLTRQSPPAIDLTSGLGETKAARLGVTAGAQGFAAAVDRMTGR